MLKIDVKLLHCIWSSRNFRFHVKKNLVKIGLLKKNRNENVQDSVCPFNIKNILIKRTPNLVILHLYFTCRILNYVHVFTKHNMKYPVYVHHSAY